MTKPVVVLRADTAPSPLTYTQLDQNFINLRDATIGFRQPGVGSASARTAKVVTLVGNAVTSTTQFKFGTHSLALDGTGDYATIPSNPDFNFGTGDFTVEGWVYRNNASANQYVFDLRTPSATSLPLLYFAANTLTYATSGVGRITSTVSTTNAWIHVALSRQGSNTRLFVNGTQIGSTFVDSTNFVQGALTIGSSYIATSFFNGYIDEFRVSKGIAKYTADFTPSTTAFTNDSTTVLLLHFNGNVDDDTGYVPAVDTNIDLNLNDRLTINSGNNIAITFDPVTKAITVASNPLTNTISQGNSNITVTDAGIGQIDFTVDGTQVMQLKASGLTSYRETVYSGGNTDTSLTPNYQNGNIQTFTANNNFSLNLPTNMAAGQNLILIITQDATGSRVMTANSTYKFVNGSKTLSTTATYIDVLSIFYDGSRYLCNLNKGYR